MLYGLNKEYGKYKKVCKSKKEQCYIFWRNHVVDKYKHNSADYRLNMEKYMNMKLRNAEHRRGFIIGIYFPFAIMIMSIYLAFGSNTFNIGIANNSAKNELYNIMYREEEKRIEQLQDKLSSEEGELYKDDLELKKLDCYIQMELLNTELTESIKNSSNDIVKVMVDLNSIIVIIAFGVGAAFAWLYFSYSKKINFYTDLIDIIHNFDEIAVVNL